MSSGNSVGLHPSLETRRQGLITGIVLMVLAKRTQLKLTIVWLFTALLTVACSSTPDTLMTKEKQLAAIDRWNQCVERTALNYEGPFKHAYRHTSTHCDGYHRDVLLTFPAHLENHVSQLLSQKEAKVATTFYAKTNKSLLADQPKVSLEKLNTQLKEAQISDL